MIWETIFGEKSLLALSIESMSLRLLACRGGKVLAWATTPINPRFLRGGFVADTQGLARVIKTAVSKKEFSGRYRILVSLPAFHSVCRTMELPSLREVKPEIAIPQQARRDMGYSAETSLLSWQPLSPGTERQRFFICSVPKEPMVTLMETLKSAGLLANQVETNTFALSRAVNQPQAIVIAVEPYSLDFIIMRDHIPQVTRSTFLGETPRSPESLPELVNDTLDTTLTFYNENNPDNPLPPDIPVYLLGSAVLLNPDITSAVETTLGHPVASFEPPLIYPPDFPKAELAVNIGLILKEL